MTLTEFINKTTTSKEGGEWVVIIPLHDGTEGKLFVTDATNEFDAKEAAFCYLKNFIELKSKK